MIKMMKAALSILLVCLAMTLQGKGGASVLRMPSCVHIVDEQKEGDGWKQAGELPMSFVMAREKMYEALRRQGWKLALDIPLAGRGHCLSQWTLRGQWVIMRIWRIEPGRTGVSWGVQKQK